MNKYKFLLINKIYTDDDFNYSMEEQKMFFAENMEQVHQKVKQFMESLATTTNTGGLRDYVKKDVVKVAQDWLRKTTFSLPDYDLGNQEICFEIKEISSEESNSGLTILIKDPR